MALLKIEDVKSHSEIAQKLRSFIEMNSHRTKKRVSQGYHKRGTYLGRRTSRAVLIMKNQRTYVNLLQKGSSWHLPRIAVPFSSIRHAQSKLSD